MAIYKNSFEGGVDGVTITTGNSGSGDDDAVATSVGANSTLTYSTESAFHGTLGMRVETTASGVQAFIQQDVTGGERVTKRFYFKAETLPSTACIIAHFRSSAGTMTQLGLDAAGRLFVSDASSITINGTLASNPLTVSTWYRIELAVSPGATATTGTVELAYYLGDSLIAVFSTTALNANIGTLQATRYRLGRPSSGNTFIGVFHFDDVKTTDELASGFIGPEGTNEEPVTSGTMFKNDFESGTNGTAITSGNSANGGNTSFAVNIPANSTVTYASSALFHGQLGGRIETTAASLSPFLQMDIAAAERNVLRFYFRAVTAIPATTCAIAQLRHSGGNVLDVRFTGSTGKLAVANAANVEITGTRTTNTLASNTWYRVEVAALPGTTSTTGVVNFAYYLGDSLIALDDFTVTNVNLAATQVQRLRVGMPSGSTHIGVLHFDDVAAQSLSSGYIGPGITTGAHERIWSGTAWLQSSEAERLWYNGNWI